MGNHETKIRISDLCDEIAHNELPILLPLDVADIIDAPSNDEDIEDKHVERVDSLLLMGMTCISKGSGYSGFKRLLLGEGCEVLQAYFARIYRILEMKLEYQASDASIQWPADSSRRELRIFALYTWLGLLSDVDT